MYKEIENQEQECVFCPWVVKNTIIDDKPSVKARLYVCGFEEEQNYRTESPTCSREGIRVITLTSSIALTSSKKWTINYIGIKRALLHYNVKCPNTELFPVRIFLYLDWIKYGLEITSYLDTFHARHRFRTNSSRLSTDGPTCSRESSRVMIALRPSKKWTINSIGIKGALL